MRLVGMSNIQTVAMCHHAGRPASQVLRLCTLLRHCLPSLCDLPAVQAEADAFLEQLESTGAAYEEQRDRNLRLEESLVARDADISRLR